MSRRGLINLIALLGVVVVVVGAAWLKEHRDEEPAAPAPPEAGEAADAGHAGGDVTPVDLAATGLPRMIDLGSDRCIPCKRMAPFLRELEQEYAGRFEIVFLDVRKDPETGRQFGIRVIPTQIFFDDDGREVWRHEGFLSRQAIVDKLMELEG